MSESTPGPDPPAQPVAVPSSGPMLPVEPLHRAVVPRDAKPHLGRLVTFIAFRTNRPMVGVLVSCPKCRRLHRYPWRWDWGVGLDVVSFQERRCFGKGARKPTWIALDPAAEAESLAAHQAANVAYTAWVAERIARKEARVAEVEPQ
jgi:hypothetical protein